MGPFNEAKDLECPVYLFATDTNESDDVFFMQSVVWLYSHFGHLSQADYRRSVSGMVSVGYSLSISQWWKSQSRGSMWNFFIRSYLKRTFVWRHFARLSRLIVISKSWNPKSVLVGRLVSGKNEHRDETFMLKSAISLSLFLESALEFAQSHLAMVCRYSASVNCVRGLIAAEAVRQIGTLLVHMRCSMDGLNC